MNQRRLRLLILLPIVLLALVSLPTSASAGPNHRTIKASDDCEAVSFNAAFGAGICVGDGETTVTDFLAQLGANGNIPNEAAKGWDFSRDKFGVDPRARLTIVNVGGEFHTFTPVAKFGGGCIQGLNDILGLKPVPECANFDPATNKFGMPSGATLTVTAPKSGIQRYQCLIHPWMQSTAVVED